jgi:hypothetical protein
MKTAKSNQSRAKEVPASTSPAIGKDKNFQRRYLLFFGILVFFLFANTLGHGYNMDDAMVTRNHPLTSKGLSAIGEIFTSPYYSDAMGYAYGYRPMVHLSFALEHDIFGETPGAGHFINVILFALSVILFFKLLVKWLGEKNVVYAAIATVLFAVHPIHTEVVASLKNRDEILAFLFVIWSGLTAHKFLEKKKWISVVSILILFSAAMLSKKSVYPMAIILPVAIIFLQSVHWKQLIAISLAMIIPAAIIGSELQLQRMIMMAILPCVIITCIYYIKYQLLSSDQTLTSLKTSWIVPLIAILALIAGFHFISGWLLWLTIPFFGWLFLSNKKVGTITLLFLLIGINEFYHKGNTMEQLILFTTLSFPLVIFFKTKKINTSWIAIASIGLVYYLIRDHSIASLLLIVVVVLFSWLVHKLMIGAVLMAVVITAAYIIWGNAMNSFVFYMLAITILYFIDWITKKEKFAPLFPVIGFIIAIVLSGVDVQSSKPTATENTVIPAVAAVKNNADNTSFLKEGRQLEYAENTLIIPHSQEESIATGFATLGEYMRLHIFPQELSFYYGFAKIKTVDFKHSMVWISIVFHLLLVIISIWQLKKRPLIAIGAMWYLLSIILFSNWVELVAGMAGERLAFTASAGFCIFITAILLWLKPDLTFSKPGIAGAVIGVCILLLAGRTFVRNKDWKDNMTLMSHDIQHLENSAQANNLYAMTLMAQSFNNTTLNATEKLEMQRTAIRHFEKAVSVWPDFFNAYVDMGRAARVAQEHQIAVKAFTKAIELNPKFYDSYYNLLETYEVLGEKDKYLTTAEELFKVNPEQYGFAMYARAYFIRDNFAKSREILLEGLKKYPNDPILTKNLQIVESKIIR